MQPSHVRSSQDRNFKFIPRTKIRRNGGAVTQSLVSVQNILGINPKSFRNAFILKIAIRLSGGDVEPSGPLDAFRKEWANAGTCFPLHSSSSHIHIHIHTLQYNTTLTNTYPGHLLNLTVFQYGSPKWCRN